MIAPMRRATLPDDLLAECRCPECAGALETGKSADPWALCLRCESGHRYFVMPESPTHGQATEAVSARFPELEGKNPADIAAFWLKEPSARRLLNEQLVELLRFILEPGAGNARLSFRYCPFCGGALSRYEQPDVWVTGLRCANGHEWAERGGRLSCVLSHIAYVFRADLNVSVARRLISGWTRDNPSLNAQLPDSVRRVLLSWLNSNRSSL